MRSAASLRWLGAVGLLLVCVAWAQERAAEADARTPEQWLHLVQQSARRLDYSGTLVYQQGTETRMSRIVHVFDGKVAHERLQPLDGRQREFIRRADEVKCLVPDARRVIVERKARPESFPALASASADELLRSYSVKNVGRERVGGFDCQVLEIQPKQNDRYGYRLWVDRASGLLLRSQTLGERGEVLEQMAFSDLRIGGVDREQLKPSWSTEGWQVDETAYKPVDLREQGWRLVPPAGFKPVYAVRRPMKDGPALQAVFSDGLASLSVFIEAAAAAGGRESSPSAGPINAFARQVGDATVTVVGEVPFSTARSVAQAAERVGR